jgi:hypothetical protein
MKYLIILSIVLLNSCGNKDLPGTSAIKAPINIKGNPLSVEAKIESYGTYADSFVLFFWPKEGSMNWKSEVFKATDSDEEKLTKIVSNVISLSEQHDDVDREIFKLRQEEKPLIAAYKANKCDELIFGSAECDEIDLKRATLNQKISLELEPKKTDLIDGIIASVDADNSNPINWQEVEAAGSIELDIENQYFRIMEIGAFKQTDDGQQTKRNSYWSRKGDIFEIEYRKSEYAPDTMMLYFKMREKDSKGDYTGLIYRFELEKQAFLDRLRFTGDVFKETSTGEQIQRGACKFELAPKIIGQ